MRDSDKQTPSAKVDLQPFQKSQKMIQTRNEKKQKSASRFDLKASHPRPDTLDGIKNKRVENAKHLLLQSFSSNP